MTITIGRGRNRQSTEIATGPHMDKTTREKQAWDMKLILLNLGIIKSLS
jgi:hypothetical protein